MRPRVALHALFALVGSACASRIVLDAAPEGAHSQIIIVESSDRQLEMYALDAKSTIEIAAPSGSTLRFVYYAEWLDELQLVAGSVALAAADEPNRALPFTFLPASKKRRIDVAEGWQPLDASDLLDVRIRGAFDYLGCLAEGRCIPVAGDAGRCLRDCTPAPPDPPQPPDMTCPEGWMTRTTEGEVTCEPAIPAPLDCARGSAQRFGSAACAPLGRPCPAHEYADDIAAFGSRIIYVHKGATGMERGTIAAPYARIGQALAAATPGSAIALSRGVFDEAIAIDVADVAIVGACIEETSITAAALNAPGARLERLFVGAATTSTIPPPHGRIEISAPGATLAELDIAAGPANGILARAGGTVVTSSVVIRGGMVGALAECGGSVVLTGSIIDASRVGVFCTGGFDAPCTSSIGADRLVIAGPPVTEGFGLSAGWGCSVRASHVIVRDRANDGIALALTSTAVLDDVYVVGLHSSTDDDASIRLTDAAASMRRVFIFGGDDCGLNLEFSRPLRVDIARLTVRGIAQNMATSNRGFAICGTGPVIARIQGMLSRDNDRGVAAVQAATLTISDLVARLNANAFTPGALEAGTFEAAGATVLTLDRVDVRGGPRDVIEMDVGGELVATDLAIQDGGLGISMRNATKRITIERASISGGTGAIDFGRNASTVRDLSVRGMIGAGAILRVPYDAAVDIARFSITTSSAATAIEIENDLATESAGSPLFQDGEVAHNRLGIRLDTAAFDPRGAMVRVRYHDNAAADEVAP